MKSPAPPVLSLQNKHNTVKKTALKGQFFNVCFASYRTKRVDGQVRGQEQIPLLPTKSSCDNSLHLFVKNSLLPPSLPLLLNLIQKEERGQHKRKTDEPYLRKDRQDTE